MTQAADTNDRLNWTIVQRNKWTATFIPTGDVLVANSKTELMSKINKFRAAGQ